MMEFPKVDTAERTFLRFEAAPLVADVYLNGTRLGQQRGGFKAFTFELTDAMKPENNLLAVRVDTPTSTTSHRSAGTSPFSVDSIDPFTCSRPARFASARWSTEATASASANPMSVVRKQPSRQHPYFQQGFDREEIHPADSDPGLHGKTGHGEGIAAGIQHHIRE
jgi:hypothetical protein